MKRLFRVLTLALAISSALSWVSEDTYAHSHCFASEQNGLHSDLQESQSQSILETETTRDSDSHITHVSLTQVVSILIVATFSDCKLLLVKSVYPLNFSDSFARYFNLPPPRA
ncbi:MAG: hypothetical protein KA715_03190 [Xanthomonadaceae bacterium]|nr:hypothetical protein [Xanthomonadaceae bacterium]